jgi:glycosyltransferase involved in cell wall biosynthesis
MLNYGSFALTCLYGLLRASRPDFIFVESPPLFLSCPGWLAGLFWGSPFIFNVADLWPDVILEGGFMKDGLIVRLLRFVEQWSYRRAAYVCTVTDWILKVLREQKSVPAEKLLFLPNGADTVRFRPRPPDESLVRELGLQGKKVILWAGTLGLAHGIDNILDAAKLLESNPDIHFLFVGDGSARTELMRKAASLNLGNVTFLGPVSLDEITRFYSICCFGLASLLSFAIYEGARPSKVFPVLASGKPLIFIGSGECAAIVRKAAAGAVVPPGDPQALANCITQFTSDPELIEELGRNGRQFIEENLQWSRLVGDWLSGLAPSSTETKQGPAAELV